ncbi:MAG: stage III sporulation protein AF [Clostridia bacterium]|nr:stage III sporulation protein AF [Clostridia bacterium]
MQALFDFIQKLSALVMIALLADLLMPSGSMRKYARLACGMLVLHIMVSQAFALLGRGVPEIPAREWAQLVGEIRVLSADAGAQEALAAYHRQAERLVGERARALGMSDPVVAIAWDGAHRAVAVVLREGGDSAAAGARPAEEASDAGIRAGVAQMLGLPMQAIWIQSEWVQKEGDGAP